MHARALRVELPIARVLLWDSDPGRAERLADELAPELRLAPLPFRSMKRYGEPFPETPDLKRLMVEWLTQEVR